MSRQRSGGRSGARTSAVGATDSSLAAPSPSRQGTRRSTPSKRSAEGAGKGVGELRGLFVTATPIGNMGDITLRALEVLQGVDIVACEDTRITRRLLDRHGIAAATLAYHEHNAERVRPRLLERLSAGGSVALVSDAGTPLISDPGFKLVREAVEAGIPVVTIPGPTAMVSALTLSALPTDRFYFGGFLPNKSVARRKALSDVRALDATLIFYESPARLESALADMFEILGPRPAALARELTKLHEEVVRLPLDGLASRHAEAPPPKGEIVIVVGPPLEEPVDERTVDDMLCGALSRHSLRDAVAEVAAETGVPRRQVYRRALALTGQETSGSDGSGDP